MASSSASELLAPLERLGMRFDLTPMRRLLAALGDPQRGLPVVAVAGTNGKGSTAPRSTTCGTARRWCR